MQYVERVVVLCYVILIISMITSILGWYCLSKTETMCRVKRVFLINFTCVQIFLILTRLATSYNSFIEVQPYTNQLYDADYLQLILHVLQVFSLFLLTIESLVRFSMACIYRRYFTALRAKILASLT